MFFNALGYTSDKVVTTSLADPSCIGVTSKDQRGKHVSKHALSNEKKQSIQEHIFKYNPQISHYRRVHAPNRLYLPSELTIVEMHKDYVNHCSAINEFAVSYATYCRVVSENNISFARLGDEECEICSSQKLHIGQLLEKLSDCSVSICGDETCEKCQHYLHHNSKFLEARETYQADKLKQKEVAQDENATDIYLSVDMQKVILLPRIPGFKANLFTKRLVTINQTFAPINKLEVEKKKALGVLWHEGIAGRNDENVASAFFRALTTHFRDFSNVTLWLDNCAGQNKCWTLYTALVHLVNLPTGPQKVTLKYFTVGYTFMSADSFHHMVEQEMKRMKQVGDWRDFVQCVSRCGSVVEMKADDFLKFESGLSQGRESRATRPKLENVAVAQFRKGSILMFFKRGHREEDFQEANFLKKVVQEAISGSSYVVESQSGDRGVNSAKVNNIIANLGSLMKPSRLAFYYNLKRVDQLDDMLNTR